MSSSADIDRLRLALVEEVVELGYENATVEGIVERAGLDREDFDRHFSDLEEATLRFYWDHTDDFTERVQAAFDGEDRWRDGLRAAAYTAAHYIRENPKIVSFGTIEMFKAGLMAQAQRESHLQLMVDLIDGGRTELDDPDSMSRSVALGVFGSIYEVLVREQQAGKGTRNALEFVPELMFIAVRPYLGHEAAREELTIPAPPELTAEVSRG
jgi:AcrR family transcriptional regulator